VIGLPQVWSWALQLVLASAVIYLFLLIARQSRGNRVVRVLVTGGTTAVVGLWGLTETLALVELQHLLSSVTGFVVVVLAIVFQPELRRALSHLSRLGATIGGRQLEEEAVVQIAAAAQSLARRRRGALIAFERESSLEPWCERGVQLEARVDKLLLESVFEPSSALHDGGVVVRGDRMVAASCVFPLTENTELAQSHGTRHRAALGLSEETDAVALVVSEETGRISLASDGTLVGPVPPTELESELRSALGIARSGTQKSADDGLAGRLGRLARQLTRDVYWVVVSAVLAAGLIFVAHEQVALEDDVRFDLITARASDLDSTDPSVRERLAARAGRIVVILEASDHDFAVASLPRELDLVVSGSRSRIERFRSEASAELRITSAEAPVLLEPSLLDWNTDTLGLEMRWRGDRATRLSFVRVAGRAVEFAPRMLPLAADGVAEIVTVDAEGTLFHPPVVELHGPVEALDRIEAADAPPLFAPLELPKEPEPGARYALAVAPEWAANGVVLAVPVEAEPRVGYTFESFRQESVEIAVVCMAPERAEELAGWKLSATNQTARFTIDAIGIRPSAASKEDVAALVTRLSTFVRSNLVAYVDLSELPPGASAGEARTARLGVKYFMRRDLTDPEVLAELKLEAASLGPWSELVVTLQSEPEVVLEHAGGP
jgi:diadenylate cyclase